MEVPVSITAFTSETLEAIDLVQLTDIQLYTLVSPLPTCKAVRLVTTVPATL